LTVKRVVPSHSCLLLGTPNLQARTASKTLAVSSLLREQFDAGLSPPVKLGGQLRSQGILQALERLAQFRIG
jgi:hypothetical protein